MRIVLMIALFSLAACSKGQAEEKKYQMVENNRLSQLNGERCSQARRVADGYLEDGNAERYRHWDLVASTCRNR